MHPNLLQSDANPAQCHAHSPIDCAVVCHKAMQIVLLHNKNWFTISSTLYNKAVHAHKKNFLQYCLCDTGSPVKRPRFRDIHS